MVFTRPQPNEYWAGIGELRVRFLDWGGEGPPVLALHGLASSANWYDLVARSLCGEFRIIAPDQRGHGQTTQATSGFDWQTLAADAVRVLDHLDIAKATVWGHSWGCNVGINVAARFPDRVASLVLIDGGTGRFQDQEPGGWEAFRARARPRDISGTREEFLQRLRKQMWFCWNGEIERIVQTMVYEDESGQMQDILQPENHAQVMKAMYDEPTSTVWDRVDCPTLLVPAGPRPGQANTDRARIKVERVQAAVEAMKDCRARWVPETVHDIGYDKPQELAHVIRQFMSENN